MALSADVRGAVARKIEEHEGRVNQLYLDSVGKVTVAIGHLVPNRHAVAEIELCIAKNGVAVQAATLKEKQDEYDRIAGIGKGYKASWYQKQTTLVMRDSEIDSLLAHHIDVFYKELIRTYSTARGYSKSVDQYPKRAQLALFDMMFNLGATGLTRTFVQFDKCIRAGDWKNAAEASARTQVSSARNAYVRQLLQTAESPA